MEDLDKFWSFIENELYCKVPQYLKVLLKLQGFDSVIAITALDDADIHYMDSFVRKRCYAELHLELQDYYDIGALNFPAEFEVLRGHKRLLKAIAAFVMHQVDSSGIDVFMFRCLNFEDTQEKKAKAISVESPSPTPVDQDPNPQDSILFVDDVIDAENANNSTVNEEFHERVKEILIRLGSDDFDKLSKEIGQMDMDSDKVSKVVASSVFEKALAEPRLCTQFCLRLVSIRGFKKALITKCQIEYQLNVIGKECEYGGKLKPLWNKFVTAKDPEKRAKCRANYQDEERKLKQSSIGIITFIGELFQIGFLTPNIMLTCIDSLLDRASDDKLEFMCILLTIVGKLLETKVENSKMRLCFLRMKKIAYQYNEISSSVRFMIQDVIDLRNRNWK